jgi:hypothetical protein
MKWIEVKGYDTTVDLFLDGFDPFLFLSSEEFIVCINNLIDLLLKENVKYHKVSPERKI